MDVEPVGRARHRRLGLNTFEAGLLLLALLGSRTTVRLAGAFQFVIKPFPSSMLIGVRTVPRRFIAGPIRSRSLNRVLDPRPINEHVVGWKPNVGISQIVIDPIAVVVDLGLCELHASKRYTGSRLSELLTRLHFLHLHSSGINTGNLAFGLQRAAGPYRWAMNRHWVGII